MNGIRASIVDRMWRMVKHCSKRPVLCGDRYLQELNDKRQVARVERYAGRVIDVTAFYAHELEDRPVTIRPLRAACFHGEKNTIHGADWVLEL